MRRNFTVQYLIVPSFQQFGLQFVTCNHCYILGKGNKAIFNKNIKYIADAGTVC